MSPSQESRLSPLSTRFQPWRDPRGTATCLPKRRTSSFRAAGGAVAPHHRQRRRPLDELPRLFAEGSAPVLISARARYFGRNGKFGSLEVKGLKEPEALQS
ncbi:hypothetical protein N658DRAFT_40931 [Parathielavia hyrcaniae]|uniref:Uncharacterized protein n=1 Tax=Parathielavia hyrcaniae TaxID=113614 RepID=A0AAN6T212_9PEZI|nr:hypothetical protein N658DRAFT_40931 [Parathielavia hyrcaniae]